jgi:hypothetical protein
MEISGSVSSSKFKEVFHRDFKKLKMILFKINHSMKSEMRQAWTMVRVPGKMPFSGLASYVP